MDLSHLGVPTGPMVRVHGGYANRMYRLDTDQGSFAVKELNVVDRRWAYHVEDVFRFERAAFAAGIPMPEPISASRSTLVHRWVEGEKVPEAPVPAAYAFEIGEILARIHALDVTWTPAAAEQPTPRDWPELAARAAATGQPWADELAAQVGTFLAIADLVDTCERPGPVVLTHKDIQPWNLLAREGRPVVLDWELSGMLDLSSELGSTALSLAKGPGFDDIRPAIFRSVLDGYVAGGGTLPPPGPSWFVFLIGGWLGHTRWNILRCLAGVEATTGPDLALSHESVRDGLRGLPDLFDRLPRLEALIPVDPPQDVRVVHLTEPVFRALGDGDLAAANAASPVPLSAYFAGPDWRGVWRMRYEQVRDDPASAAWVTGVIWDERRQLAVGRAGYHGPPDAAGLVEIGYAVDPAHRRRGYARAALEALLQRAAGEPGVHRVRVSISPDNLASYRLASQYGFTEIGEQWDDEDGLEIIYEVEA